MWKARSWLLERGTEGNTICACQTCTVVSILPETMRVPSGDQATDQTAELSNPPVKPLRFYAWGYKGVPSGGAMGGAGIQ